MIVYLAGHGRMNPDLMCTLPGSCRLKFGVPREYRGSGTVSKLILGRSNYVYPEIFLGGSSYPEHFLGPDLPFSKERKGEWFGLDPGKRNANNWLLQTKGEYVTRLSQLVDYLVRKANGAALEIVWTCCRSPVKGDPLGKWEVPGNTTIPEDVATGPRGLKSETGVEPGEIEVRGVINDVVGVVQLVSGDKWKQMSKLGFWSK